MFENNLIIFQYMYFPFFPGLLLSSGADPNVKDESYGMTAMDRVREGREDKSPEDRLRWIKLLEQFQGRANRYKDR